jgi:hypothetical protein
MFNHTFDLDNKNDNQLFSKWKFVVNHLIIASEKTKKYIKDLPLKQRDELFESSYMILARQLYPLRRYIKEKLAI